MRSWRSMVNFLLVLILVVVIIFLLWTNANYNTQLQRQIKEANNSALTLWMESTEVRLTAIHKYIYEILLTIFTNTPVNPGSSSMGFDSLIKTQTIIDDKLTVNHDPDCFFVLDTDTDWFLFASNQGLSNLKKAMLKEYSHEHIKEHITGLNDMQWFIAPIEDEIYFIKGVSVGKYIVGAMCSILNFDVDKMLNLFGEESSCMILYENEAYYGSGEENWVNELKFKSSGEPYLDEGRTSISKAFPLANCTIVVASRTESLWSGLGWIAPAFLAIVSLVCVGLILLLITIIRRKVIMPTHELLIAHQEITNGNIQYRITVDAGSTEFETLYNSFNDMASQIHALRIESYDRLIIEQENRLQMVRAQIKPHFYLNAITTVSNMTYQNRLEDIRTFLQALAKYMRYMLNIQSQWITISEELSHIDNYLKMQQLRFPGSVNAVVQCSADVGNVEIPFLILFTLVENTFKHALNLYKTMELRINCEFVNEKDFHGCRMIVEDNGDGFPEDILEEFESEMPDGALPPKEHLGLSNIRYTLQITYKRGDLLRLSNRNGGARAEIWIPIEEGKK